MAKGNNFFSRTGSSIKSKTKGGSAVNPLKAKLDAANKKYTGLSSKYDSLNSQYGDLNNKWQARLAEDSANPNRNLKAATIQGNESNTRSITSFNSMAENLTNRFNQASTGLTNSTKNQLNDAYNRYNEKMTGYSDAMGTADQDIHTRNRGQAYAGLDSGFADASDDLQASLARRGLANSGIAAKSMGDLGQARMRAGAEAGVNAYTSAIDMSDSRRTNRMNTLGNLYGAEQGNINTGYQMGMANLGQNYGNTMAVRGQALQNTLNNNQQRIANLMGYAQLGRGMAGMSQNYLSQAGSGYTNIAGQAGQTAIGIGGLNNSYNATMQQAQTARNAQKSEAKGAGLGMVGNFAGKAFGGASAMAMFSDNRLKDNLKKLGVLKGHTIYSWTWNDKAKMIGADNAPAFGVVAQDIMMTEPEAVVRDPETGFWKVDYDMLFGGE